MSKLATKPETTRNIGVMPPYGSNTKEGKQRKHIGQGG